MGRYGTRGNWLPRMVWKPKPHPPMVDWLGLVEPAPPVRIKSIPGLEIISCIDNFSNPGTKSDIRGADTAPYTVETRTRPAELMGWGSRICEHHPGMIGPQPRITNPSIHVQPRQAGGENGSPYTTPAWRCPICKNKATEAHRFFAWITIDSYYPYVNK